MELKIDRLVEVMDLGADGIDLCDARLNGIQESQIDEANLKYQKYMEITLGRLKERYPQLF